jgi:hypothetical protein
MRPLRLAVAGRLTSKYSFRESGASRVLGHLLLALLPLALVLMYASSFLCSMHARVLHPRPHRLAGVLGPLRTTLLPLPQAQHRAVTASRTRG